MAECNDKNCYIHGNLRVRGGRLEGKVVSTKGKLSVVIERDDIKYLSKYSRYAKERSRIAAHLPPCIHVELGDKIVLGETRKISKTKAWTVIKPKGA